MQLSQGQDRQPLSPEGARPPAVRASYSRAPRRFSCEGARVRCLPVCHPFWCTPSRDILRKMRQGASLLPKGQRSTARCRSRPCRVCASKAPVAVRGTRWKPCSAQEAFFTLPYASVTGNPRPDLCIPIPCGTGAPVGPQHPPTSLLPHESGTSQRQTGHCSRRKILHSGIV